MPEFSDEADVPTTLALPHPRRPGVFLPVHRRPRRLAGVDYADPSLICFVTMRLERGSHPVFRGAVGEAGWQAFLEVHQLIGFRDYGSCVMPDHLHGLWSPSGAGEAISDIVGRLKTWIRTSIRCHWAIGICWQESFYDHVLRESERSSDEFDAILAYIRGNPVDAGLVEEWRAYPFVSSGDA